MIKKIVVLMIVVSLGAVAWIGINGGQGELEVSNAYVTGRVLNLAAHADGVVDLVKISRGDQVKRGELLLALDSEQDAKNINQRDQELRVALKEELTSCLAIEVVANSVTGVEAKIDYLKDRAVRTKKLTMASVAAIDELRSLELQLQQELVAAEQEKLKLTGMKVGENEFLLERPKVQLAVYNLREAHYRKHMNEVRAPYDGYIYEVLGYPSAYARAGESQVIFVPTERPTVEANVLESELQYIKPGLRVTVIPDASPNKEPVEGYIHSIVPSAAATFSKLPRNNVDSNWIKVSQRVPVLIGLIAKDNHPEQYPIGTSVRVLIPTSNAQFSPVNVEEKTERLETNQNDTWVSQYQSSLEAIVRNEAGRAMKALSGRCKVPRWE